jgi:hypothetical protein
MSTADLVPPAPAPRRRRALRIVAVSALLLAGALLALPGLVGGEVLARRLAAAASARLGVEVTL